MNQKINRLELKFKFNDCQFILKELLLLYYKKYNIEKILYINIKNLIEEEEKRINFYIKEKIPLKLYDAKDNNMKIQNTNHILQ